MKINKKDLNYYLNLDYKIVVEKIPEESGGGFEAYIEKLGKYTCNGNGETREEAIQDLLEFKDELMKRWYAKGYDIPEPEKEKFSGRFTVRVPIELHKRLHESCKRENVSFNQYIVYLIGKNLDFVEFLNKVKKGNTFDILLEYKIENNIDNNNENIIGFPQSA